jgi:hypothetical protein
VIQTEIPEADFGLPTRHLVSAVSVDGPHQARLRLGNLNIINGYILVEIAILGDQKLKLKQCAQIIVFRRRLSHCWPP